MNVSVIRAPRLLTMVAVACVLAACDSSGGSPASGTPRAQDVSIQALEQPPSRTQFLPAWQFARFAGGRGSAPAFSPTVTVIADGAASSMTADEAADPASWRGTAFDLYAKASSYATGFRSRPHTMNGVLLSAEDVHLNTVTMHVDDGHDFVCGGQELPEFYAERSSLWLSLSPPDYGGIPSDCTMLNVFITNGRIDAVVARTMDGWRGTNR